MAKMAELNKWSLGLNAFWQKLYLGRIVTLQEQNKHKNCIYLEPIIGYALRGKNSCKANVTFSGHDMIRPKLMGALHVG